MLRVCHPSGFALFMIRLFFRRRRFCGRAAIYSMIQMCPKNVAYCQRLASRFQRAIGVNLVFLNPD